MSIKAAIRDLVPPVLWRAMSVARRRAVRLRTGNPDDGYSPSNRRGFTDLTQLLEAIRKALAVDTVGEQLEGLSKFFYRMDTKPFEGLDPFEPAYRDLVLANYRAISGNDAYDPAVMERTEAIENFDTAAWPIPYRFGDSRSVGEYLSCYGWILTVLDVKAGADILEYGSGEGQLSIQLARMNCNVHAIDIEARFLASIERQCQALGIGIQTKVGRFGDGFGDKKFDRVVFFEAFHHCFDHQDALMRIHGLLKPDGFICFSGEPILGEQSPDRELLPYHWGLRLDGEAVRAISEFGWMELGYAEAYFVELLARCGYAVESRRCPGTWRGDAYIARPFGARYPIERDTLIMTHDGRSGWHKSEGPHRWTDGDAWFPLPRPFPLHEEAARFVEVEAVNLRGKAMAVELVCGERAARAMLASGESARLTLELPPDGKYLRIKSDRFTPSRERPASKHDHRFLGVAVRSIRFSDGGAQLPS